MEDLKVFIVNFLNENFDDVLYDVDSYIRVTDTGLIRYEDSISRLVKLSILLQEIKRRIPKKGLTSAKVSKKKLEIISSEDKLKFQYFQQKWQLMN